LVFHPATPNTIYVGTDIGIFRSTTGGGVWSLFSNGLPPVVVSALASHPNGVIQAATYGRGAFELTVNVTRPTITSAIFNGTKKVTVSGARFGNEPRVLINGADVSSRITSFSDSSIKMKGKTAVLGLRQGDNSVVVIGADGLASTAFSLRL
ncbi:MAG TPA: hypothetical protein VKC34_15720, partial [Blastocatellia bacterium]|nr:hypothetical protein [Blastocatellia bacterium]